MAKELPYFQFEPGQYLTGNIQLCSFAAQGIFNNICSVYWQRGCNLSEEQMHRKFKNQELIDELLREKIIKVKKGAVVIEFLKKQHTVLTRRKSKLSLAGLKGGLKSSSSKNQATPKHLEDKRKEENKLLREKYFSDLPNSESLQTISADINVPKETLLLKIPAFRKAARTVYKDFPDFCFHFKNWVQKIPNEIQPKKHQPA